MIKEPTSVLHGWIWADNLLPFAEATADLAQVHIDLQALAAGVARSDAENDKWYTFDGPRPVTVRLARTDDGQVLVEVDRPGDDEAFATTMDLLLDLCCRYRLMPVP